MLASYYWFSQTPFYNETLIGDLPWHILLRYLIAGLAMLMVSEVPYPAWPTFSLKTIRGALGLLLFISLAFGLVFLPREFFFPVGMLYVLYGVVAAVVRGLVDRSSRVDEDELLAAAAEFDTDDHDEDQDEGDDIDDADPAPIEEPQSSRRRRRRRRSRRGPQGAPSAPDRNTPPESPE